jgi:hypothetical protein
MNQERALREEKRIFELCKIMAGKKLQLADAMRAFKLSGAWACTPQHHFSFSAWAKFNHKYLMMSVTTVKRYARGSDFLKKEWENVHKYKEEKCFMVTSIPAVKLRKAIELYRKINGDWKTVPFHHKQETKRMLKRATQNWIIGQIAQFYLDKNSSRSEQRAKALGLSRIAA